MTDEESRLPPLHCPPANDCQRWAFSEESDPADLEAHAVVDRAVADAWIALAAWVQAVNVRLAEHPSIGPLTLEHPEPDRASVRVGVVDAALAHMVVASVQRAGVEVDGLYVGLVAQEPSSRWIGLAGIFVPVCSICHGRGVVDATDRTLALLEEAGFVEIPASAVPEGMRPQPGWFDRDRLQTVARRHSAEGRLAWSRWPPPNPNPLEGEVLVRVRPSLTDVGGLILCPSSEAAMRLPRLLGKPPGAWTWTGGRPGELTRAIAHRPRCPVEVNRAVAAGVDWWTADQEVDGKPPGSLSRGRLPRPRNPGTEVRTWTLDGQGAATLEELETLAYTPALFSKLHPRVIHVERQNSRRG